MKLGLRVWILIFALILAFLAVAPWKSFEKGVLVRGVEVNSTAFEQGLRGGQIINSIDGQKVENLDDFSSIMSSKNYSEGNLKTIISTNEGGFILFSNNSP